MRPLSAWILARTCCAGASRPCPSRPSAKASSLRSSASSPSGVSGAARLLRPTTRRFGAAA
eukprot:14970902-Alexandrium_andersonii.AAC.1